MSKEVENLTDELRSLVAYGAAGKTALCPMLRLVTGIEDGDFLTPTQEASEIVEHLRKVIKEIDDAVLFHEKWISPAKLRECFDYCLKFKGETWSVEDRRARVVQLLGQSWKMSTYRRVKSPERELLRILAEILWAKRVTNYQPAT